MKNKVGLYWFLLIIGVITVCIGMFALRGGGSKVLSGVSIGLGAGLFGMAAGELIKFKILDRHPEYKRKIDIEAKDERNIYINNLAKAKAFSFMIKAYGTLILVYVLMNESLETILFLVGVYLLVLVVYIGYFNKYSKEL